MAAPAIAEIVRDASAFMPEQPRPLWRELPPAEPFPLDALGAILGPAARAIGWKIQAPDAICAQSVLATATLAVQPFADVVLPFGQRRPLSCFFVSLADSGDRKTSADYEALWPIRTREAKLREIHAADMLRYDNGRDAWDAERRRLLNERNLSREARARELDQLGPAPARPLDPMLTCPEPTYEGLIKLFAIGWPSLGVFSAEGGQFIGGHGLSKDNRAKTVSGLSDLWDGGIIKRVRSGDGSSALPGRRLSVHLLVQPLVATALLADELLDGQGFLSRLLVQAPESLAGTRLWHEPDEQAERALKRYGVRLLAALEAPLPLRAGTNNELEPRKLEHTPAARKLWIDFSNHVERQLGRDGGLEAVKAFGAKAPEHASRLGAVLQLVDDLHAPNLDEQHLAAGVELAQHYANEWLRLHEASNVRSELRRAQRLLTWLQGEWALPVVGLPEVYRLGPNALRTAASAREALAILEDHGWIAPIDGGAVVGDTFRREAWRIVR